MRWILSSFFLFTIFSAQASVAEKNINPEINRHYQGALFRDWVDIFEKAGREVYDRRLEVVDSLKLKQGMNVADIGAGTGFYSLLFAERVGVVGNVYAVDVTEDFILNIHRRAQEQNLKNIHTVLNSQTDTLLAANSIDLAFVCDTYHHFEYPATILASIHRSLRPDGKLVIIDFRKIPGVSNAWVMSHVRGDKQQAIKEIEAAGFRLMSESDLLKSNYMLWFEKKTP